MFQLVVFGKSKGDYNLVQLILRQYDRQIFRTAKHFDSPVFRPSLHIIRKNSPDNISPFRIHLHSVNILFRRPAVSDQQDMLLVIALTPHAAQTFPYNVPYRHFHTYINAEKHEDHQPGKIRLPRKIQIQDERH